jgi:hypothetical protein
MSLFSDRVKYQLTYEARRAAIFCIQSVWQSCMQSTNHKPEEPDFVASFVTEGTRIIGQRWGNILSKQGINLEISSVYCHQRPKIEFKGMQLHSVELGDLLWCHFHRDKQGNSSRNAILYQCKKTNRIAINSVPKENPDQFTLYSRWPEFKYVTGGQLLRGHSRLVRPSLPRRGAQYLLVNICPYNHNGFQLFDDLIAVHRSYPTLSCIARLPFGGHADLGCELVNSLFSLSGDPFDDKAIASTENGWSQVIWDLIYCSLKKAIKRKNSNINHQSRVVRSRLEDMDGSFYSNAARPTGLMRCLFDYDDAVKLINFADSGEIGVDEITRDDEDGGISVIIVETSEERGE